MEKSKSRAAKFLKLDKLGQRILHTTRAIAKRRKERAERNFQRSLIPLT